MPIRFQVDPDFYDHPKSIGLSDAATALWVRAGSYSAAKLLDGFIAEHVLGTLSRSPEEAAAELVARGLWRRTRGGFLFHQYGERNLLKSQVEAERVADRERKRSKRLQGKSPPDSTPVSDRNPNGHHPDSARVVSESVSMSVSTSGRPRGRRSQPTHTFVEDELGGCANCSLPANNRVHRRAA